MTRETFNFMFESTVVNKFFVMEEVNHSTWFWHVDSKSGHEIFSSLQTSVTSTVNLILATKVVIRYKYVTHILNVLCHVHFKYEFLFIFYCMFNLFWMNKILHWYYMGSLLTSKKPTEVSTGKFSGYKPPQKLCCMELPAMLTEWRWFVNGLIL
jgi:hypothetical protein